jgi:hypothetical protein
VGLSDLVRLEFRYPFFRHCRAFGPSAGIYRVKINGWFGPAYGKGQNGRQVCVTNSKGMRENLIELFFVGISNLSSLADSRYSDRHNDPLVLGWLDQRNFEEAWSRAPFFAMWSDYSEFVAERDLLHVGYQTAGVSAQTEHVSFQAFERWSRLTGAPLNIDGLDEFAAHSRWRRLHPNGSVIGRFGAGDNPERHSVGAANTQFIRIRPEVYLRWRDDFSEVGLFPAPDLDAYAAYVVEAALLPDSRSRFPMVNSS